jgi:hypothetical protein
MTRRRTRSIAAVLALCLIVPAGALAQKPGQTATQFYLAYRDAFAKASAVEQLFPYMSKATRAQVEKTPAAERPKMFELIKMLNEYTNVKVVKETRTPDGITLAVEAIDSDKNKSTATITIVTEDGSWKIGKESWSTTSS